MKKIALIYIFIILIFTYIAYTFGEIKVIAQFKDLEPFNHRLPVYYKGFKLGHTSRLYPTDDFTKTNVHLLLRFKDIKLPDNTTAVVKNSNDKDYIELVYPTSPSITYLRHGSIIQGEKGASFEKFISEQAQNGGLEEIKLNVNKTISSAGTTFDALTEMINVLTDILNDVRPTINETANNVNFASKNLADTTLVLKNSVEKGYIDNTLENIELTSKNLVVTTDNFSGFAGGLKQESVVLTNCLLKKLNVVVNNINEIVVGLGNTLKKRFGGLRLIFGKGVSQG